MLLNLPQPDSILSPCNGFSSAIWNLESSILTLWWPDSPVCHSNQPYPPQSYPRRVPSERPIYETAQKIIVYLKKDNTFQGIEIFFFSLNLKNEMSSHTLVLNRLRIFFQLGSRSWLKQALVTLSNFCSILVIGVAVSAQSSKARSWLALMKFFELLPSRPDPW